jgi:aminoglycoside phosphotransferase (APT) family kinase protein
MADLGVLLCYWSERGDGGGALLDAAPTMATGFSTRDEVLQAYAAVTDLDVSSWAYYQAFGYWKLACILQGVYFRYLAGAGGGDQGDISTFPAHINSLAQRATTILGN